MLFSLYVKQHVCHKAFVNVLYCVQMLLVLQKWDLPEFVVIHLSVFLLSRSARLTLHSCGNLYVHGETAPVHLFRRDAGETAIRHPLPRGPSQRLRRLDNPTFASIPACPSPAPVSYFWPLPPLQTHSPGPSSQTDHSSLFSAAITQLITLFWVAVNAACLSLLFLITVYTDTTFHDYVWCIFFEELGKLSWTSTDTNNCVCSGCTEFEDDTKVKQLWHCIFCLPCLFP